ncbi:hypothetical protein [Micromonospora sp. WMMD736]|uniref:hypothetical protein n=1 Tax=Micromonospora sp. WMMD736 TaxID=3404112 RepID=UPI003B94C4FB
MKHTIKPTTELACRAALLVGTAAAAAGMLLAPAASAATESAVTTIGLLEAQGFDVRVDRIGTAPLDECQVTAIRNPQEQKQFVRVDVGRRDRVIPVVVKKTITVSLDCSR